MSSRKAQREEARARRVAEEQARAEAERRTRRMQMLAGVVAAAVAVVIVAVVISSSGGTSGVKQGAAASALAQQVNRDLTGIPQTGPGLGNGAAAVKMFYYGDLQCPVCRDLTMTSLPQVVENDVRAGKVQVVYRATETATRDPQTFATQQAAALAAGRQGRFWQYIELFYRQQGVEGSAYVTEAFLDSIARQIPGLNFQQWKSDRTNQALVSELSANQASAVSDHVGGTPTLVVQGPRGRQTVPGVVPTYDQIRTAIQSVA